jgi:MFS family permease
MIPSRTKDASHRSLTHREQAVLTVPENNNDDNLSFLHPQQQPRPQHPEALRHRSSFDIIISDTTLIVNERNDDPNDERDTNDESFIRRSLLWNYQDDDHHDPPDQHEETILSLRKQHYASTAAICLCTFTHSWLLVSVFPYAGFMVIHLVPSTTEETVGTKAGLLSAAFMIGRALTSYGWGQLADTYGRRIVIITSLVLSAIFSIVFGLSTSFGMAFWWRFLLGASNGVAGISKAIVSETSHGDHTWETRGMSLSMGMWAWGFLFSPGISGLLSDPIQQYPTIQKVLPKEGILYHVLERFPFVLPNLISVVLCLIDIVAVEWWVPETLPKEHLRSSTLMIPDTYRWLKTVFCATFPYRSSIVETDHDEATSMETVDAGQPLHQPNSDIKQARMVHSESVTLLSTSYPHIQSSSPSVSPLIHSPRDIDDTQSQEKATLSSLWSKRDTRNHLLLYWIFSFVAIAIDEAFPLFCISKTGGLGISARAIGKLLSATGLIFAMTQYHVYAWIVDKFGLVKSIQIGAFVSAPLVLLVPCSLILNAAGTHQTTTGTTNTLTWSAFIFLGILLAVCRIFGLVFFSSITIATNRTVLPCHRGTMNGLSMLGGSFAKGLGPIVAGWLTAFGISSGTFSPHVGAVLVFVVIGMSALITACMTLTMLERQDEQAIEIQTSNDENDEGADTDS